jgi:ABC-2 type transport system permease protein
VMVQTFVFPVMLLVTMRLVFGETMEIALGDPDLAMQRMVPLMALSAALFGGLGSCASLIAERNDGLLARLQTLPGPSAAMPAGRLLADAIRTTAGAAVLAVVGLFLGFGFHQGAAGAIGYLVVVALYGQAFGWLSAFFAARARSVEQLVPVNTIYLTMLFLNVGFVPVEGYPGFLQPVVRHAPHSRAVEALVGLTAGGPVLVPLLQTLAWIAAITAIFAPLATRRLRHQG